MFHETSSSRPVDNASRGPASPQAAGAAVPARHAAAPFDRGRRAPPSTDARAAARAPIIATVGLAIATLLTVSAFAAAPTGAGPGEAGRNGALPFDAPNADDQVPFQFNPHPAPAAPPAAQPTPGGGPVVHYGEAHLPGPVAVTRARLVAAARTGEIERLRPIFEDADGRVSVAFHPVDDPVTHLASQSGDPEGREILAILIELLSTGWVRLDPDTPRETYVWPYFAHVPIGALTPAQEVELYTILTAVDVEEMERLGGYAFFRVGIAADGTLRYFSAEGF